MKLLTSKKLRVLLAGVACLVLVVGAAVLALNHGYLIHFTLDNVPISRDEFYRNAYAPADEQTLMYCTSGLAPGFVYLWDVHCYSTEAALNAYMNQR